MQVPFHNDGMAVSVKYSTEKLKKPGLDNRKYRVIKLPNKLEALLIHDPDTDKASAAMNVGVGHLSDDDDMPGMAHAIEHLLFMGTEKHPGENDFKRHIQSLGGSTNAFTSTSSTCYHFQLSAPLPTPGEGNASPPSEIEALPSEKSQAPLRGALHCFAQFFIKPLFHENTIDRELRAVDSEYKKNLQNDTRKLHQLNKSLSNKAHPFHKFSTGNYKVLRDDPIARGVKVRDKFIEFYEKHYSANRMKLVVLGREGLDEQEGWVADFFSDVPNLDLPKLRWDDVPALSDEELGKQIFAKPVKDTHNLELEFPYIDEDDLWDSHPSRYISHLIGHEGPGSILAYIKTKGWADGLEAGLMPICPGTAHFNVNIRLTKNGLKNYHEVIKIVFQYIAVIKEAPPQECVATEMMELARLEFEFREKAPADQTTIHYSCSMQKAYPTEKLLSADSLIEKFDPDNISRGLGCLRVDNFRLWLESQSYSGGWDLKEQWYGTEYKYEPIPADFLKELDEVSKMPASRRPAKLHMPYKNEFVPTRFDVAKEDVKSPLISPKLIRNDENVRTWWKKDDQFWTPKANIKVCFRSAVASASALTAVLARVFRALVKDSLTESSYDAALAGLTYDISNHDEGFDVSVSGYNDKIAVLLEKVLLAMQDVEVEDDRFNIIKDRLLRGWRDHEYNQPFQQIGTYSHWLLSEKGYVVQQLLDELPSVTADDVRLFIPQVLGRLHIELLIHGNICREDALKIADLVESTMAPKRLPPFQWSIRRSLVLPQGSNHVYERTLADPQNVNHCIDYQLYTGLSSDRVQRARLLVFAHMIDEPCFDTLRSKEQLGYVVQSDAIMLATVSGFKIIIQSERSPEFLEKRIEVFLNKFGKRLGDMSEEDFAKNKNAVIGKREEKLKNLNSESARFWHHIASEAYDFELVKRDVENIRLLTKSDLVHFFNTFISPASPQTRAKLVVHLRAQNSTADIAAASDPASQTAELADALSQEGQGKQGMDSLLPSLGIVPKKDRVGGTGDSGTSPENKLLEARAGRDVPAVEIVDVRDFKLGVPLSEGLKPVRDLAEFEELEVKL